MLKELFIKLGGIDYKVEVDIFEDYVIQVFSVWVWNEGKYYKIKRLPAELKTFYKCYEDALNECWQETKENEDLYYREKGELL